MAKATHLSPESVLCDIIRPGDFLDCYTVNMATETLPLSDIAQCVFTTFPWWARVLLGLRDVGVSLFGLKTTARLPTNLSYRETLQVGESINFLRIQSLSENEIILGEDDTHLDFRISFRRDPEELGQISLATLVHTHNRFGRFYLSLIKPFHVLIVKTQLDTAVRKFAGVATTQR